MSKHTIIKNISLVTYEAPIEFVADDGTVTILPSAPSKTEIYVSPENKYEELKQANEMKLPLIVNEYIDIEDELTNIIPRYHEYTDIKRKIKYKENINVAEFKELLFGNGLTAINHEYYNHIDRFLDLVVDDEKMRVRLSFNDVLVNNKNGILLSEKTFTKLEDGKVSYYYDEKTPSIVEYKNATFIPMHSHFFMRAFHDELSDNKNKEHYLKCYHYFNLNIIVYIHVNFNKEKITPAIVITDENHQPTEIHYFYKNKYVPAALIDQIKPNLLNEDFKEVGYFDKRDIDFLDMAMFK